AATAAHTEQPPGCSAHEEVSLLQGAPCYISKLSFNPHSVYALSAFFIFQATVSPIKKNRAFRLWN
ncbi:hypothetical protein, partial [Akkermansia sp.]